MLTIQKNDLFQAVKSTGVDPSLFKLDESSEGVTTLAVGNLPLKFQVRHSAESFNDLTYRYVRFAPSWPWAIPDRPKNFSRLAEDRQQEIAEEIRAGWFPPDTWCNFQQVTTAFKQWLQRDVAPALANVSAPDLWSEAAAALPKFEDLPPPDELLPFTAAEQQQLKLAVEEFKRLIAAELKPDTERLREINTRLDYLSEAVSRLNRFDWKALALSTVIGVGTTLSVDATTGRQLWALFHQAIRTVSHLIAG